MPLAVALPAPLAALIQKQQLTRIIVAGFGPDARVSQNGESEDRVLAGNELQLEVVTGAQLLDGSFLQRAELVALSQDCLQQVGPRRGELIAKCRDQLSQRVLLQLPVNLTEEEEAEYRALGFVRCAATEQHRYYLFDLKTYKTVPDWLNPRFWANPQNWEKFRW